MSAPDRKARTMRQTVHQRNATGMLLALAHTGKHVYLGTVPSHVKAQRRERNRRARAARRTHRKAAS